VRCLHSCSGFSAAFAIAAVTEWHCNILAQIAIGQKRLQDNRTEMANDVVTNSICCYFNAPDCLLSVGN